MVFFIQKMLKYLNYRYFSIDDQMADDFFWKKWEYWMFWLIRTKTVGFPVGWWIFRSDYFFWPFPVLSVILNGNAPFFYTNTEKQNFISFLFFAPLSVGHICRELFLLICWLFCVLLERQQFLEKYMSLAAFSEKYIGIFHSCKFLVIDLMYYANTLPTRAKRVHSQFAECR